jgi:hypothetical protein
MFPQELLSISSGESSVGAVEAPSSPHRRVHTSQLQRGRANAAMREIQDGELKMASRIQERPLDKRETSNLIGSDKVEGTPVYRLNGDNIGQIDRVMIAKISVVGVTATGTSDYSWRNPWASARRDSRLAFFCAGTRLMEKNRHLLDERRLARTGNCRSD